MPNWCNTAVVFEGKKAKELYEDFQKAMEEASKDRKDWLGNIFIYNKLNEEADIPYCRSFVNDIQFDEENNAVRLYSDDAWTPAIDAYNLISKMYGLNYVLRTEEPGCGVYINTDIEGKYFPERYYFEFFGDDIEDECKLLKVLDELNSIQYFTEFEEIRQKLKDYGVETEEDMKYFCEYVENKYPYCGIIFQQYDMYIDED